MSEAGAERASGRGCWQVRDGTDWSGARFCEMRRARRANASSLPACRLQVPSFPRCFAAKGELDFIVPSRAGYSHSRSDPS